MKKKLIFAVCLVLAIFGLQSCGKSGNNGESNTESYNSNDSYSEITYAIDVKQFSKFEVTLYSDGTGFVEYVYRSDGEKGEEDCRWHNIYATYRNQKAAMYMLDISINHTCYDYAIRVGTNEAYCVISELLADPQTIGSMTLGSPEQKTSCRIIRKK